MTIYNLVSTCASHIDKVRIETYDPDFGDNVTIGTFILSELFNRAESRTRIIKHWWIEDQYEHIHGDDIRLIKRVLVAVVGG